MSSEVAKLQEQIESGDWPNSRDEIDDALGQRDRAVALLIAIGGEVGEEPDKALAGVQRLRKNLQTQSELLEAARKHIEKLLRDAEGLGGKPDWDAMRFLERGR